MSMRRRLFKTLCLHSLSTVCLLSLGTATISGQQKNPFADWDQLQKKTELPESTRSSARGNVQYFSPSAPKPAPEKAASTRTSTQAAAPATENGVVREKMKPRVAGSALPASTLPTTRKTVTPVQTAAGSNASLPSKTAWPSAFHVEGSPTAGTDSSEESSIVRQASITDAAAEDTDSPVRTVSSSDTGDEEEVNPFEQLLSEPDPSSEMLESEEPTGASNRKDSAFDESLMDSFPETAPSQSNSRSGSQSEMSTSTLAASLPADGSGAGPQQPGVSIQWVRHGDLNVGQLCELELVVENTSTSPVRGVMVETVVPVNLAVKSSSPEPVANAVTPSWTFGELKPGEKRSVMLQVIPRDRNEVRLNAFVRLTGFTSASFAVQEPQIEIQVNGPESIEVGQQLNYSVQVSNPGTGVARNVLIQAAIPEGLEHRRGSLLTIDIGTLNPGESRQAQLNLTAVKGGSHELAVRVVADGGLTDQKMSAVEIAEPKLAIEISGPASQMSGRTEEYVLQVTNDSIVPSANVRAKYRVPEGFEFVSAGHGGKYDSASGAVEWFLGTLAPGQTSNVQMSLRAVSTGTLVHQAGVISEHGRVTMAELATEVEGIASLEMNLTADRNDLRVGDEVVYEIEIRNSGTRPASSVGISCELPSGLELIQAAGPSEYIAENGIIIFKSLPELAPGKTVVIAVKARCSREGTHRLRTRVASESIQEPLIGEKGLVAAK
ncbi:MAG: DUF11 domain-containing protein [Planctomyces sp.]|nr:DUF11 domain-containing protein [Planctomyces sp.]